VCRYHSHTHIHRLGISSDLLNNNNGSNTSDNISNKYIAIIMSSKGPSRANTFFMCATVMGLGMLGGFLVFFSAWQHRCSEVLAHGNVKCNATIMSIKEQYDHARSEDEKASANRKYAELEECLGARTALASKYQELLQQHADTQAKAVEMEKESEARMHTIHNLNEQVKRLQRDLGQSTIQNQSMKQKYEREQETLKNQLQLARTMLMQRVDEVEELRQLERSSKACDAGTDPPSLIDLRAAIQRRALAETMMRYGPGPYHVQFTLDVNVNSHYSDSPLSSISSSNNGNDLKVIRVELSRTSDMPHTTWTFLSLVERGFYKGTTLMLQQPQQGEEEDEYDGGIKSIVGGSPSQSINKRTQAEITRRYTEFGYGLQPFLFEEVSSMAVCNVGGLSIMDRGPGFRIYLSGTEERRSRSCVGRIVSGEAVLQILQSMRPDESMVITDAVVLAARNGRDEL
jgi:cyclophilin family peptidyl-prolyl cis-trans isomerase